MVRGVLPVVACLFAADSLRAFVAYHGKADVYLSHILGAYPVSSGNADSHPVSLLLVLSRTILSANHSKADGKRHTKKNGYKRN